MLPYPCQSRFCCLWGCSQHSRLDISVFLVPRRTLVCEKVFQEEGVAADVTLDAYPLEFIPLEPDLLSLEHDSAFKVAC